MRTAPFVLVLALACQPASERHPQTPPGSPAQPQEAEINGRESAPDSARFEYYAGLAQVLANHGVLIDSAFAPSKNRFDSTQTDTVWTFRYATVTAHYLHFGIKAAPMFIGASFERPVVGLPFGIGIGTPIDSVIARFGPPYSDTTDVGLRTLSYEVGGQTLDNPTADNLFFRSRNGLIVEILWAPYAD